MRSLAIFISMRTRVTNIGHPAFSLPLLTLLLCLHALRLLNFVVIIRLPMEPRMSALRGLTSHMRLPPDLAQLANGLCSLSVMPRHDMGEDIWIHMVCKPCVLP